MADPAEPKTSGSVLLGWGMILLGMALSATLIVFGPDLAVNAEVTSEAGLTAIAYMIIFAPMAAVGLLFARVEGFAAFRLGAAPARWSLAGIALGFGGLAAATGFAALAGTLVREQAIHPAPGLLAAGFALIVFQTASEELFFRGWLLCALERRVGVVAAIAVSAVLFAAFHVLGGARDLMSLFNLLLGGVWFALLAWRSGGLLAPTLAHFGWNLGEELVAGLSPNPGVGPFGALFDWDLVGSPLWGGSEDGLNTSIGMAAVLAALIVPLVRQTTAPGVPAPRPPGRAAG
jgi:membrane protease YdiL (CAAX protease family)